MLFKISLKNIRKSLKDYTVYFFTLILGVAIFYVFNAIDSQSVMLDVRANMMDIINTQDLLVIIKMFFLVMKVYSIHLKDYLDIIFMRLVYIICLIQLTYFVYLVLVKIY